MNWIKSRGFGVRIGLQLEPIWPSPRFQPRFGILLAMTLRLILAAVLAVIALAVLAWLSGTWLGTFGYAVAEGHL